MVWRLAQAPLPLPQTFMNLSGEAVVRLARKKNIALKDLLIVCDDVALTLGRLKIKPKGSAGGHNGLSSIIEKLGSDAFPRLRCGIAREGGRGDLADFVLSVFDREEKPFVQTMLVQAVEAMESWLVEGIEKCMGRYNGKNK